MTHFALGGLGVVQQLSGVFDAPLQFCDQLRIGTDHHSVMSKFRFYYHALSSLHTNFIIQLCFPTNF
jgi:hypothetical protein